MRASTLGLALSVYAITVGCLPTDDDKPGELLGAFQAVGHMDSDSCGPVAVPQQTAVTFELREDEGGVAYWQASKGGLVSGTILDGTYRFPSTQTLQIIEPDAFYGIRGCVVTRREVYTFSLEQLEDEAAEPSEEGAGGSGGKPIDPTLTLLRGTHHIEFTPLSGADCDAALFSYGGTLFSSLPCETEYTLTGNGID